jgi:hypothetical protein
MSRIFLVLFCGLLGGVLSGGTIPRQVNEPSDIPADKNLVIALRFLNTEQVNHLEKNHRFADRDQMLSYLQEEEPGALRKLPVNLQDASSYSLAITTSADGQHYQITLQRNATPGACQNAAFTDDRAVIYLGRALGCDSTTAY